MLTHNYKNYTKKIIIIIVFLIFFILFFSNVTFSQTTDKKLDAKISSVEDKSNQKQRATAPTEDIWIKTALLPDDLQDAITLGIKNLHSFEFDKAEEYFKEAIRISPNRAFGYVYLAALNWVKLYEDNSNPNLEKELEKKLDLALKVGRRALKKDFANSYDYLMLALGRALSIRTYFKRGNYFAALIDFRDAIALVKKASEMDNGENIDAQFGLALYNAYTGSLPKYILTILNQMTSIKSNVKLGIDQVNNVSKKGSLFRLEARLLQVNIYSGYHNNFNMGKYISNTLIHRFYPKNMINNFMLIDLYIRHKKYDQAIEFANKVQDIIKNDFQNEIRRNIWHEKLKYYYGKIYFHENNYKKAKEIFLDIYLTSVEKSNTDQSYDINSDINPLGALFRLGIIYDLEGDREKAKKLYSQCLESNVGSTIKDYAALFYEKAYQENDPRMNIRSYQEYYIP